MPLKNRIDPWGKFNAVKARGKWLGNRGILHNDEKEIIAPWRHKSWVTCRLEFKNRKREIFSPNHYSELFFLDEATALAAGHRPCAECRRERYNEFKSAWLAANREPSFVSVPIKKIDNQLHSERAIPGGDKVTFNSKFSEVPIGAFIELNELAVLVWNGKLYQWSPSGYSPYSKSPDLDAKVTVLTPKSFFVMLQNGFIPQVDDSVL